LVPADEEAHVEGHDLAVLEAFGDVAFDDAPREAFGDRGLAHAGSPMRTGLFFVRRERTCMTRRISSSRPMTGSSLPLRASSVRSRQYFASVLYFASGVASVTRRLPRTFVSAASSLS
jgi:hypothetical protein